MKKIYGSFIGALVVIIIVGMACQPQPIIVMAPGSGSSSAYPIPIQVGQQPSNVTQQFDIFLKIQQIVCNTDPLPTCIQKIQALVNSLNSKQVDGGVR